MKGHDRVRKACEPAPRSKPSLEPPEFLLRVERLDLLRGTSPEIRVKRNDIDEHALKVRSSGLAYTVLE